MSWEVHQPHVADHRIEAFVGQAERLAVRDRECDVRPRTQPLARPAEHGGRDVGGCDVAGRADGAERRLGSKTGAGRHVETRWPATRRAARSTRGIICCVICPTVRSYPAAAVSRN